MRTRERDRRARRIRSDDSAALGAWREAVASGGIPVDTVNLLESLGEGAMKAWVRGEVWESRPKSLKEGETLPEGGGDARDPFRLVRIAPGWEVRPAKAPGGTPTVVHILWIADSDSDGEWSHVDEFEFGSPGYYEWVANDAINAAEAWVRYLESVSGTGEDPLGKLPKDSARWTANVSRALRSAEKRLEQARFQLRCIVASQPAANDDPAVEIIHMGDLKRAAGLIDVRLREACSALRDFGDPEFSDDVEALRGALEAASTGRARCPNCGRILPGTKNVVVAMVEALRETTCHEVDPTGMAYDCV